jgi:hypothetical protein
MAARHGHPRSSAASPFAVAMKSNTSPFAIALALLGVLAIVIAIRDSSQNSSRSTIRPLYDSPAHINSDPIPPSHPIKASPEATKECTYDNYVYPQWPEGFNVSVQAAFILGALISRGLRPHKRNRVLCSLKSTFHVILSQTLRQRPHLPCVVSRGAEVRLNMVVGAA